MQYPTLISPKAINFGSKVGFSPYYDIVWSFDYAISGNDSTEAGFTFFLSDEPLFTKSGSGGIDLGYSGTSPLSSTTTDIGYIKRGVSRAAIGIGFDTTGLFAASAYDGDKYIRDGVDSSNSIKNSISIRGRSPYYSFEEYSFCQPITALNSSFSIVASGEIYKTLRARLGNIGRTLYIDYRNNVSEEFQPIIQYDINIPVNTTVKYYPGVSFATPLSSISPAATGNIFIKNIHIEGGR